MNYLHNYLRSSLVCAEHVQKQFSIGVDHWLFPIGYNHLVFILFTRWRLHYAACYRHLNGQYTMLL